MGCTCPIHRKGFSVAHTIDYEFADLMLAFPASRNLLNKVRNSDPKMDFTETYRNAVCLLSSGGSLLPHAPHGPFLAAAAGEEEVTDENLATKLEVFLAFEPQVKGKANATAASPLLPLLVPVLQVLLPLLLEWLKRK